MTVKVTNNIPKAIKIMSQKQTKALKAVGQFVKDAARLNITNNKTVDTGRMRQDVNYDNVSGGKVDIGNTVNYAIYIEKGTRKMTAKPFLVPAAKENTGRIKDIVANIYGEIDNV